MCDTTQIRIGDRVRVRSGQYIITAIVVEISEASWKVRNSNSGREFQVRRILDVIASGEETPVTIPASQADENGARREIPEESDDGPIESPQPPQPLSLVDAAFQVLKQERRPMSTTEMVRLAIERQFWTPCGGKTPEQTLYSRIHEEISRSRSPRFKKSSQRGRCKLA